MIFLKTLPIRCGLFLLYLCSFLPYKVIGFLGRTLGKICYFLFKGRRRIVLANIKHCFPEQDAKWHQELSKHHFNAFTTGLIEQSICWWWSNERLSKYVEIIGLHNLREAKAKNKGVILLFGHFTTLEMGWKILGSVEKAALMYRSHDTAYFDNFVETKRSKYLSKLVDKESPLSMVRLLKKGQCIWFGPDQNFVGRGSILASFFNQVAPTTPATAKIVAMTGAQVVPITQRRKTDGSGYELFISPALENFSGADELADTNRINKVIENMAYKNIVDYYWVHRRFKNLPKGHSDIYK